MSETPVKDQLDPALARRLHRALTAGPEELHQVLRDPAGEVLSAALKNPRLDEDHLLVLLKRRDLGEDLLRSLYELKHTKSSHRLKLALAKNPHTPGPVVRALLPHLYLFELVDLCFLAGGTPDQRLAAERAIIERLPEVPLGNKLTLARRAPATVAGEMLKTGDSRLVEACLNNPRLKEVSILQFLNGPHGTPQTISAVARHPRWRTRPNLRQALLKNSKTPPVWHTLFLPQLSTKAIRNLLASRRLNRNQKQRIREELKKRSG